MKYRIKITEKRNGEKWYVPQAASYGLQELSRITILGLDWKNIVKNTSNNTYELESTVTESWKTEEEALAVIVGFQDQLIVEGGEEPCKVSYKMIE